MVNVRENLVLNDFRYFNFISKVTSLDKFFVTLYHTYKFTTPVHHFIVTCYNRSFIFKIKNKHKLLL